MKNLIALFVLFMLMGGISTASAASKDCAVNEKWDKDLKKCVSTLPPSPKLEPGSLAGIRISNYEAPPAPAPTETKKKKNAFY